MRRIALVALMLALPAAQAPAQLAADFGPRGEVRELRSGGLVYFRDIALSLIRPGWAGAIVDQRSADPADVRVERRVGATIYSETLRGAGCAVRMREVARVDANRVRLAFEVTPEESVDTEAVLLQGAMPAALHAGVTRWIAAGATVERGLCPAELPAASYILFGSRGVDWVGFARPGGPALRVVPSRMSLQFQDNRCWHDPDFALLATAAGGRLAAGKTIRFSLTYVAEPAARLDAEAAALSIGDLAHLALADNRRLRIGAVAADRRSVCVFDTVELTADIAATYTNPFDPRQIAVDAEVTRPDGRRVSVPGFYYAPMRLEMHGGIERLRIAGRPGFRVRYTPTMAGKYRLVVTTTDRSGTARSKPTVITAVHGASPGFVRRAKRSPHYFAFDNGRPYFAVGENVCWASGGKPIADYAAWFRGLGKAGGNWARLWLSFNEKGLEWTPAPTPKAGTGTYLGLGRYALDNAWRLDRILRLAQQNGIRVMLCLGTYGEFTEGGYFNEGAWVSNPYNAANGGPCAKPSDFWTNPSARRLYKQRLRYLIARWGAYPAVFGWEFWNEVPPTPHENAWVAEMAAYLKRHDPNHHLVSTTYGDAATWRCSNVDFTMTHMYGQAGNTADFTPRIAAEARAALPFGKPYLLAEFGIDWQTGDGRWDPRGTGVNMHNGAWAAMMSGAAGTSMLWYWDSYVAPHDLYHILTPARRFADTIPWATTRFASLTGIRVDPARAAPETFSPVTIPASVEWGTTPSADYTVRRDGSVQGGPVAMTVGSPQRANPRELHSRLTWHVDLPAPERVTLQLGWVSDHAHLMVLVDGSKRVDRDLPAGPPDKGPWKSAEYISQYKIWQSDYDEDIALDLPAGAHTIAITNTSGDWLQIRSITIPAYRSSRYPEVNALGLASPRLVLLWLQNRESTWRTDYDGKRPHILRGLRVSMPASGAWRVAWWDTWTGAVIRRDTVRARDGAMRLTPPPFARDLAARCVRVR